MADIPILCGGHLALIDKSFLFVSLFCLRTAAHIALIFSFVLNFSSNFLSKLLRHLTPESIIFGKINSMKQLIGIEISTN